MRCRPNGWLMACGLACAAACLPEGAIKGAYNATPLDLQDDWSSGVANAQQLGVSRQAVTDAYAPLFDDESFPEVTSLLVVRNGYLIAEGYFNTLSDARRPEHVMELTQVVTALMAGVASAEGEGEPIDAQQPLASLLPAAAGTAYAEATLGDLLTMRSGVACPEDWLQQVLYGDVHGTESFTLRQSRQSAPGAAWRSQACAPHLVGLAVANALDEPLEHAAQRLLFDPIGITDATWSATSDGDALGGAGLMLTPRDLARLGAMVWRGGSTRAGAQLVPASWIDASTRGQVPSVAQDVGYGYFWYTYDMRDAALAQGQGGQYLYIDRRYDLVVVMTSAPHANGATTLQRERFMRIIDTLIAGM